MNNNEPLRFIACAAMTALVAACASYPAIVEGEEDLAVHAWQNVHEIDPLTGAILPQTHVEQLAGVTCALSNGEGTWTVTTPASAHVRRSGNPLQVECVKEGFHPGVGQLPCLSPRERRNRRDVLPASGAVVLAVTAAAIGGPLAPLAAGEAVVQGAIVAVDQAIPRKNLDVCTYGGVTVYMTRLSP